MRRSKALIKFWQGECYLPFREKRLGHHSSRLFLFNDEPLNLILLESL